MVAQARWNELREEIEKRMCRRQKKKKLNSREEGRPVEVARSKAIPNAEPSKIAREQCSSKCQHTTTETNTPLGVPADVVYNLIDEAFHSGGKKRRNKTPSRRKNVAILFTQG